MKRILRTLAVVLAAALFAVACGSADSGSDAGSSTNGSVENTDSVAGERIETLWVGPQLEDCVGAFPQTCLLVRRSEAGQVEFFYDYIDGFEHVAGTSYVLKVGVSDVEDPPADASSVSYRLIEIIESSSEPATAGIDGTAWQFIGFKDGDLFDPVPEDIEITLAFDDGRVAGSSGCNRYGGDYTADGDALAFGPLMGTRMACQPEVMDQEQRFLSIMETVETAALTFDERLVLKPASGLTLVFVAG